MLIKLKDLDMIEAVTLGLFISAIVLFGSFIIYVDGVAVPSTTAADFLNDDALNNVSFVVGNRDGAFNFNGVIDEVQIYNKTLSVEEVEYIFNYGGGGVISNNFSVTAVDAWNSSTINSFNVSINGTTYNTTTGTITTNIPSNSTSLYDVLITADGYNTRLYEDYNVSSNLEAVLYPFNSLEVYTKNVSSGVNISNFTTLIYNELGSEQNITVSGMARFSDLVAGVYTVRVSSDGFNDGYYTLTVSNSSFQTLTAYLDTEVNEVILQVQDEITGNNLPLVTASQYAFVNSTLTLVQSKLTDISGRVVFNHDGSSQYKLTLSKDGYVTKEFFLTPLFDSYTTKLTPLVSGNNESLHDDVFVVVDDYLFLSNATNYFNFSISSAAGALSYYNVTVVTPNNSSSSSGTNAYGEVVSVSLFESNAVFGSSAKVTICYLSSFYGDYVCKVYYYPFTSWTTSNGGLQDIIDNTKYMGRLEKALLMTFFTLVIAGFLAAIGSVIGAGSIFAAVGVLMGSAFFFMIEFINPYVFYIIVLVSVLYIGTRVGGD